MSRSPRRPLGSAGLAALGAAIVLQLSCVAASAAAQGVALDTGRITVETPLVTGKSYQLAKINVRNPGTQRTKYDLIVTPIETSAHSPEASWITFSPKQVTVQGGKQQIVSVSIRVPKGAAAGRYEVLVGARIAPSGNGMGIAAAAAARLTFSVAGQPVAVQPVIEVVQAWWPVPALAMLAGGLWLGRSRFKLRMPIERR